MVFSSIFSMNGKFNCEGSPERYSPSHTIPNETGGISDMSHTEDDMMSADGRYEYAVDDVSNEYDEDEDEEAAGLAAFLLCCRRHLLQSLHSG